MGAKNKNARRGNVTGLVFTLVLIGLQILGLAVSASIVLGPPICDGTCTEPLTVRDFGYYLPHIIINSVYILSLIGAGIFSAIRLRAGKIAFWLPLIAIGINVVTLVTVVLITATIGRFQ